MTTDDDIAQLLDKRSELGARHRVVISVDEARMQAELAQERLVLRARKAQLQAMVSHRPRDKAM